MRKIFWLPALFCLTFIQQGMDGTVESPVREINAEIIEDVYLKAPDLSDEKIIGYQVGVRPYRKSGIRLESEPMEGKILIHNYGYGGSGLTLCWGGAQEVLTLLEQEKNKNRGLASAESVAVLGAGVIGLATAYELLESGYQVNLYADEFSPNLTSDVAAGIWSPPATEDESQNKLINKILDISDKRFRDSAFSEHPEFAGIRMIASYGFKKSGNNDIQHPRKFKESTAEKKKVRVHFDNGVTKIGEQKLLLTLDGKIFMNDLFSKTKSKGAVIYSRRFTHKNEVAALNEKIIVNCTSLGSRELFNDEDFVPVRGHLVYLQLQEGIDYLAHQNLPHAPDFSVLIYPWSDRLILGGVFENGEEELRVDPAITNKIIQHARECFSSD